MRSAPPDAAPIVELRAAEMPTKHGKKSKPVFKIVGWKNANARPTDTANTGSRARGDQADYHLRPSGVG